MHRTAVQTKTLAHTGNIDTKQKQNIKNQYSQKKSKKSNKPLILSNTILIFIYKGIKKKNICVNVAPTSKYLYKSRVYNEKKKQIST